MRFRPLRIALIAALLAACAPPATPTAPTPTGAGGPHGLVEPFLAAWRQAGGDAVGAPLTPPLWVDDYQTQLFPRVQITAIAADRAVAEPRDEGWQATFPADLLALPASPWRASLRVADPRAADARPLTPLDLELRVPGYDGPAELRLFDAALRPAGSTTVTVSAGLATAQVLPRGRLGPQWVLALIDGQLAGARSAAFTLDAVTELTTGDAGLDALYPRLHGFMERAAISYELDGARVHGYRSPDIHAARFRDRARTHRHIRRRRRLQFHRPEIRELQNHRHADGFRRHVDRRRSAG